MTVLPGMQTLNRSQLMGVWENRHACTLLVGVCIDGPLLEDNLAAPPNFTTHIAFDPAVPLLAN